MADEPEEVMEGVCTWYFENGQKEQEITYKYGILNGSIKHWYSNGQMAIEGKYQNGARHSSYIVNVNLMTLMIIMTKNTL